MDLQTKLIYLFVDLIIPLVIGNACRRQARLDQDFFRRMIMFNICAVYPFLTLLTMWKLQLNYALAWLPLIGVLICVIPGGLAYLRVDAKFSSELDKGSYMLSAILSNTATLGGLCAYIMFGEVGFAYTQMVVMLQNVVMFMFCFPLAQYYYQKSIGASFDRQSVTKLFLNRNQLPVVGMAIGLLLNLVGIGRPAQLEAVIDPLVHLGAWTALLPIGYAIDTLGMRTYYGALKDLIPIKLVFTPAAAYLIARALFQDEVIVKTIVILAAMPTAINTVIAVQIHRLNIDIATAAFVLTTAACIVVELPLLFFWLSGS